MMARITLNQWDDFQHSVAAMDENSSPRDILHTILSWLRRYPQILSSEPFSDYSFDQLISLKEEDYPVGIPIMRDVEFMHFKKVIKRYRLKDAESIARYLRDTVEALVVLEVEKQCPRCESLGMNVYKNRHDGRIAFECRQCGLANYSDRDEGGANELTFASNNDLHDAGLI